MNDLPPRPIEGAPPSCPPRRALRLGVLLSIIVALVTFVIRSAGAQDVTRLTLGDAARLAARQSSSVESAQQRVVGAEARVREARSATLPTVSTDFTRSANTLNSATFGFSFPSLGPGLPPLLNPNGQIIGPVRLYDFRAHASEDLFDYAAMERVRGARLAVTAAGADVATTAEQAASKASMAYLTAIRSDAQLTARLADSALAADLLSIARDQLTAGVGVALDVTRAQAQVADERAQLIAARNNRDRGRLELVRALNLPAGTRLQLTDSLSATFSDALVTDEQAAVDRALKSRPELRALDDQLQAAREQVAVVRAERLPTLGLFGEQGEIGLNLPHMLPTFAAGLRVSVPIFNGFQREGRIQEQQAAVRDVEIRRRDLEQQAATDVRAALLDLSSAREQVDASRERLALGEQEVLQARDRFRAGVAGNADVITALLALNRARNLEIDALTNFQTARVALARAEGSLTELR